MNSQDRGLQNRIKNLDKNNQIGSQYVVLIAINKYNYWLPLKNPVKDAKEIKEILSSRYYIDNIYELYDENATKSNIIKLFDKIQKELKINDSLLIFYAGHGHLDEKTNTGFWIPVNAGTDEYEQDNWLPNSQIRGFISRIEATHICLISDSCFSGDILNPTRSRTPTINDDYFTKAYSRVSRLVLTSGSSETVPDYSEFSSQLKICLKRNNNPYIDPLMIYNEIRLGMKNTTPLFGELKETNHQEGASFLLFLREKEDNDIKTDKNKEKDKIVVKEEKKYGSIKIDVKDNGKLFIDNEYIMEVSPDKSISLNNITVGSHNLRVEYSNDLENQNIVVEKNKTSNITFNYYNIKKDIEGERKKEQIVKINQNIEQINKDITLLEEKSYKFLKYKNGLSANSGIWLSISLVSLTSSFICLGSQYYNVSLINNSKTLEDYDKYELYAKNLQIARNALFIISGISIIPSIISFVVYGYYYLIPNIIEKRKKEIKYYENERERILSFDLFFNLGNLNFCFNIKF